jgi:hypothetical protein
VGLTLRLLQLFYTSRRPLKFVGPSMPTSHRHFLQVSSPLFRVCSPSELSSSIIKPPWRALQLSTSAYNFSYCLTYLSYMTRAWGMPASFVYNFYFPTPRERFGSHSFPSLSNGIALAVPINTLSYNGTLSRRNIDVFRLYVCS